MCRLDEVQREIPYDYSLIFSAKRTVRKFTDMTERLNVRREISFQHKPTPISLPACPLLDLHWLLGGEAVS